MASQDEGNAVFLHDAVTAEIEAPFDPEQVLDEVHGSALFGEPVRINYFDAGLALEAVSTATLAQIPAHANLCSFFDTLPQEILPNILRNMSKRPCAENWFASFDEVDAFATLQSSTPLSTAAEECFDSMYLGNSGTSLLHENSFYSHHWMKQQGARLRSLTIDNAGSRVLEYDAARNCTNLQKLTLQPDILPHRNIHRLVDTLEACGRGLKQLSVLIHEEQLTMELIHYATNHCTTLGVFEVFRIFNVGTIMSLLFANHRTLHTLNILYEDCDWTNHELTLIASNCKNLENLDVPYDMTGRLCALLGDRVRSYNARCDYWEAHNLSDARQHCPNATIFSSTPFDEAMLEIGGEKLRTLTLDSDFFSDADLNDKYGRLRRCFSTLRDLRKLKMALEPLNEEPFVNAVFALPKPQLEELDLDCVSDASLLDTIAAKTTNLKSFKCITNLALHDEDYEALLAANQKLAAISITLVAFSQAAASKFEEHTSRLVRRLRHCKHIRSFTIQDYNHPSEVVSKRWVGIENACVALRSRQVTVRVGEIRYLPIVKQVRNSAGFVLNDGYLATR